MFIVQPASRSNLKLLNFLAAPAFHGQHCSGSTTETEHCNTDPCPGEGCQLCLANVLSLPSLSSFFLFLSCHFCLGTSFLKQSVVLPVIPVLVRVASCALQMCYLLPANLPSLSSLFHLSCCVTFALAPHSCHNLSSSQ